MITDGKKWHYLAVKSFSRLLRGITSNHDGDFYCLHCFHSYRTENKLEKHEQVCNNHDYCCVEMSDEFNKICNHGEKSLKAPAIVYADLECLLEKRICAKMILKDLIQKRKLNIRPLIIQYLQVICLTQQKTNLIITKMKIVWKCFAKF